MNKNTYDKPYKHLTTTLFVITLLSIFSLAHNSGSIQINQKAATALGTDALIFLPIILNNSELGAPIDTPLAETGKGVTVVIFDRGLDWQHPDFINPDGTTRIKWILDMTGQNWCTANQVAPVEYSEAQINAALQGQFNLPHRDAVGHGTATAGAAAGNGRSLPNGRFAGVAPDADLIIVKNTSEGAPAHGSYPAEAAFNGCMDEALDWADAKITELGQPAVGIWNAGTQWGPMDGTSALSRKIEEVFGPNRPGRIWVASSGDEGSLPNHSGGNFNASSPGMVRLDHESNGTTFLTAWYSGEALARISIKLPNGNIVGPVGPGFSTNQNGVTIVQYVPGNEFYPWTSTGGDRAVWMSITGHEGIITFIIESIGNSVGRFDLYGDILGEEFLTPSSDFLDLLVPGRLNDVSATVGAVVVGVHVERDSYTDIDGIVRNFSHEGVTGDLWLKSSGGPTRDGRFVLDVTALGQNSFASLSQHSYWSTIRGALPMAGEGYYVRFGGTSGAGPIVVGTIALMLEANPDLTAAEVKQILRETAVSDQFTGETPNPNWGYGKLDITAAVQAARDSTNR
ncbi:MAG: S8 family serine peptidase [Chloroflexota bacterium]